MAMLGRCLAFHLKYPAEMARLYWTEEPDHEGLQDAERVLRMIRVVGDTACREAADFLSACAERLEPLSRQCRHVQKGSTQFGIYLGAKI